MQVLHSYTNGNTQVVLYEDGSKERSFEGTAVPVHPESIDVKITNYCDAGCSYCHEKSTVAGQHGDLQRLGDLLAELPAGVEIALGGGNPLAHPDLEPFLKRLQAQGLVVNITINQKHLSPFKDLILDLIARDLVKGVGISYSSSGYLSDIAPILLATNNVVFHLIMGINKVNDVKVLHSFCQTLDRTCKILLLGYKNFGFGINYYLKNKKIEDNKYSWYTQLAGYFKQENLVLSFDNLAISQLKLRRYFTDEAWNNFYMGDDFVFSMYIDGIEQHLAPSSTATNRVSFKDHTLLEYFQQNRKES
jgi:hypothetical protein